jgi:divalent metal cation (Fe/Co/Zn/Cd) transporter
LDPIVAIMVALLIIKEAWHLCKTAFDFLLDSKLSDEDEAQIIKIISENSHHFKDFHKLKTRKSGNVKHIDFHITLDPNQTVEEAHQVVGCLKKALGEALKNARVNIHIDPYNEDETK